MEAKNKNIYFILSAIFMALYPVVAVIRNVQMGFQFNLMFVIELMIMFVIGCSLFTKRVNVVITALLGVYTFINAFYLISQLNDVMWWSLANLSSLISSILLVVYSVFAYKGNGNNALKLWFLPAIFSVLEFMMTLCALKSYGVILSILGANYMFFVIALCVLNLLASLFMPLAFKEFSKSHTTTEHSEYQVQSPENNNGYCDMTKHILLLVFIGWIWQYIWIYKTTDYLNKTPSEEKRDPATKLLLCMFVPFYYIYWIYQSARRIEILAKEKNIDSDIVTLSVVLSLFVGIVPPIIMQSKLNQICKTEDKNTTATETYTVQPKVETNSDKTDEIRNYKKLLDDGIITEEEFEAKKKQLLGL